MVSFLLGREGHSHIPVTQKLRGLLAAASEKVPVQLILCVNLTGLQGTLMTIRHPFWVHLQICSWKRWASKSGAVIESHGRPQLAGDPIELKAKEGQLDPSRLKLKHSCSHAIGWQSLRSSSDSQAYSISGHWLGPIVPASLVLELGICTQPHQFFPVLWLECGLSQDYPPSKLPSPKSLPLPLTMHVFVYIDIFYVFGYIMHICLFYVLIYIL